MNAIETARSLATQFATELNETPNEAQNWSPLDQNDDLPEYDYAALRRQFGEVTPEMEREYRSTFNSVLVNTRSKLVPG